MSKGDHSCGMSGRDDAHRMQDEAIRQALGHIKNTILVMSGKGGVGKSSVAACLAVALAKRGHGVGLMDVDFHGPSIPRLLGLKGTIQPSAQGEKAYPVRFLPNMQVLSIETLMGENRDTATIWRGPLKIGVIRQFIADMAWGDLDYLIVDSPPGTGDEPLTVAQTIPNARALIVTTPQEISLADVRKSINFCRQVNMEILGLVENMSGLECPHCGQQIDLFKTRGGGMVAETEGLRLLATLPIEPEVVRRGDMGTLGHLEEDHLAFTRAFGEMADLIIGLTHKETPATVGVKNKLEDNMEKITFAIPVAGGKLCSHFGHCEQFALIETENGKILGTSMHTPPPHEPGVLPRWLHEQGADVIIAGGMGSRALDLFRQNGIKVVTGAQADSPEMLVNGYLLNSLVTGDNVCDH